MSNLVIIPTYNERENIERIITSVFSLERHFSVLIVDDGSPDGTGDIVRNMITVYGDRLQLIERAGKQGLGTAYIVGFKLALEQNYDYIFEMDADFSHKPSDLPRLLESCENGADVAIGSRYVKGGDIRNWPRDRIIISKGGALYTKLITGMPVQDPTAGFVCYKRSVLEKIPLSKVQFIGYAFQIEMKYRAWKLGFRIKEVPIVFEDRREGSSKMSSNIVKEAMYGVWKMRKFSK